MRAGQTGRLHRRIDNLLAMARLEAGKARPRCEPTPPADLFYAVRENLPLVFQSRPVTVQADLYGFFRDHFAFPAVILRNP